MPMLKIKVCNADGGAMHGLEVKVTGCGQLLTDAEGRAQFLTESNTLVAIEINGADAWSGPADSLNREEIFLQSASGFTRSN